jgi:hypothetical protein
MTNDMQEKWFPDMITNRPHHPIARGKALLFLPIFGLFVLIYCSACRIQYRMNTVALLSCGYRISRPP